MKNHNLPTNMKLTFKISHKTRETVRTCIDQTSSTTDTDAGEVDGDRSHHGRDPLDAERRMVVWRGDVGGVLARSGALPNRRDR